MPSPILMYFSESCPFCIRAEQLLQQRGITAIDKIHVDRQPALRKEMTRLTGQYTVPQIFIGDYHVGGCDELFEHDRDGRLAALLASTED